MLLNATQKQDLFKIAVYGRGGVGKTHLACTAPKSLVLLTERQGFATLRAASKRLGIPTPVTIWVRNVAQVRAIVGHLRAKTPKPLEAILRDPAVISDADLAESGMTRDQLVAELPYERPETVFIDMFGEIAEWVANEVDESGGMEVVKGIETRKLAAWNPIQRRITTVIRAFRDMPYHVVFLCHDRIVGGKGDDDLDGSQVWPKLPGRELHKTLMQSVNAMGRMKIIERHVDQGGKNVLKKFRVVEFVTSDAVLTKHAVPLREKEPPDVGAWIRALSTETAEAADAEQDAVSDEADATNEPNAGDGDGEPKKKTRKTRTQETQ